MYYLYCLYNPLNPSYFVIVTNTQSYRFTYIFSSMTLFYNIHLHNLRFTSTKKSQYTIK